MWLDLLSLILVSVGFPGGSDGKGFACNAGDLGSIPGEGNGNPLRYSCLENSMDGGESQTWPNNFTGSFTVEGIWNARAVEKCLCFFFFF